MRWSGSSRVSKILVGLLTSALLPVASRLDERGSSTTFQRLGELGLIMLPMFTLPPLAAAASCRPNPADVDRPCCSRPTLSGWG